MVLFKEIGFDPVKLRQLLLVEEFKRCINSDVKAFLDEKEIETLDLAARLADDYSLTHKASFVNKPFPRKPFNPQSNFTSQSRPFSPQPKPYSPQPGPKSKPSNPSDNSSHSFTPKPNFYGENKGRSPLSQQFCKYCKRSGHIISKCLSLKRKKENQEGLKPTGLTSLRLKPQSSIQDDNPILAKTSETDSVMEIYEPFLSTVRKHVTARRHFRFLNWRPPLQLIDQLAIYFL